MALDLTAMRNSALRVTRLLCVPCVGVDAGVGEEVGHAEPGAGVLDVRLPARLLDDVGVGVALEEPGLGPDQDLAETEALHDLLRRGTPASRIDMLQATGIKRVVDARQLPLSRRRGFSKSGLGAALADTGIRYEHAPELRNPKPIQDRYTAGDVDGGATDYRAHLHKASHPALIQLADSVADESPLRVEESHDPCHRAPTAGAIAERLPRVAIVHL